MQSVAKIVTTLVAGLALGLVWGIVVYSLSDSLADNGGDGAGAGREVARSSPAGGASPVRASGQELQPLAEGRSAPEQNVAAVELSPTRDGAPVVDASNKNAMDEGGDAMGAGLDAPMKYPADPSARQDTAEQANAGPDDARRVEAARVAAETPTASGEPAGAAAERTAPAPAEVGTQAADGGTMTAANAAEERRAEDVRMTPEALATPQSAGDTISTERAAPAQAVADKQAAGAQTTSAANAIEDRLQAARQRASEQVTADFAYAADRAADEQAMSAANALENRLQSARQRTAKQATANFADAAAAEQAALARIEADRQAMVVANAVEARSQSTLQRAAEQATADFADAGRAEEARLAPETPKGLQDAANAEAAKPAAQIEADKQPADEEAMTAANAVEDRLQAARQRAAVQATADFADAAAAERAALAQAEADKPPVAAQRVTDEGAMAAARPAGQSTTDLAAYASGAGTAAAGAIIGALSPDRSTGPERLASDNLARQALTPPSAAAIQPVLAPRAATASSKPSSVGNARKNERVEGNAGGANKAGRSAARTRDRGSDSRPAAVAGLHKPDNGGERRSAAPADAPSAPSVVASLNRPEVGQWRPIFMRRCPSILERSGEYDDDLVSLCRTWGARR